MPEARLGWARVNLQTRIILSSPCVLSQVTRTPRTLRHSGCDPAFGARQNFRETLAKFLPISSAHSPALFRIQLCEVTHSRRNRDQTARGGPNPLLPNATATIDPSGTPHLGFESAVLLLKGGAVFVVGGTLHDRAETRTFEVDGETCGSLSRRVHDRTSSANADDVQIGRSCIEQAVDGISSGVKSVLDRGGKTNIPRNLLK